MLIGGVSGGAREGDEAGEYRAEDELFEMMARGHGYHSENQSLSTRDLVILYENIDVGTKLMSDANVRHRRTPNQRVETVVYKDDSEDSDISETYSKEDLRDVFAINNERIDLINNISSVQHPLCQKFGDIEIQTSNINCNYDSNFLFKDPYIKEQLQNINILPDSTGFDSILPATLLDYICCKRLEDNYNFYMDNIIRYVQHTIEQLKRISNGDYLTDRAKEKWREVAKDLVIPCSDSTKVLATSISIPLHVMGKADGHRSTWDDIVHSEVDVRSLSKILEKKIIIEIPKLICGSYKLFSEFCADNLIISCKKDSRASADQKKAEESRVDVVFQLKPSGSGHVISNINSIMILQKIPSITSPDPNGTLNQEYALENYEKNTEEPRIIEIENKEEITSTVTTPAHEQSIKEIPYENSIADKSECNKSTNPYISSDQANTHKELLRCKSPMKILKTETNFTLVSPDELRCTIRRLNMQTPVPEEAEESVSKKKSPTRVRIKSPYENQSYTIEEKKRKKLLEIRDKREKKKMALSDNCKITKHKYGKSAVMAQPSSSVTKLSITNKSFYNSIYGENANLEGGITKKVRKSQKKELSGKGMCQEEHEKGLLKSSCDTLGGGSLDAGAAETIVQTQGNVDTETWITPISAISNYNTDVSMLSQLIGSSGTYFSSDDDSSAAHKSKRYLHKDEDNLQEVHNGHYDMKYDVLYPNTGVTVPVNSPKETDLPSKSPDEVKKTMMSAECRKSINKVYGLLKTLGKRDDNEIACAATQLNTVGDLNIGLRRSSTMQVSDSGTSVKHCTVSSNPSTISFGKNYIDGKSTFKDRKKKDVTTAGVPKVMISTKLQTLKVDTECSKTDRKRVVNPSIKVPENPLKAISQLLHEFSNVQKTRYKTSSKKTKQELSPRDAALTPVKCPPYKERRSRLAQSQEPAQIPHPISHAMHDDRPTNRLTKKHILDIIDEAKEARGEAVRGPSKPYSRLNALAQPKKAYIQAQTEENQYRHQKITPANRFHRGITSTPLIEKHTTANNYVRNKRKGEETSSTPSAKPVSSSPPLERMPRARRSASNSPARKGAAQATNEPPPRLVIAPKSPEMKKKMVAVESYVKSHYGHVPFGTSEPKVQEVHKTRVPLIPNDIDLASSSSPTAEESTSLGNQLHYLVDTVIKTTAPALSVLTECKESGSKSNDDLHKQSDSLLKIEELKSESDYPVDIFEDKSILTAVACMPKDTKQKEKIVEEINDNLDRYDLESFSSATELQKLETALYQRMSVGAFPKRLRIKNLTLTPKQSLQQVIVVQSGDASSLLVKSSLSQNLKKTTSKLNSLTAIKPLAALSNTNINWGFSNIPLQVATVGYAFPTYESAQNSSLSSSFPMLIKKPSRGDIAKESFKSHKTSQCFKGVPTESSLEQATQANILLSIPQNCDRNIYISKKHKDITKLMISENLGKNQGFIQKCEKETCDMGPSVICKTITEKCEIIEPITGKHDGIQPKVEKNDKNQPIIESSDKAYDMEPITIKDTENTIIKEDTESLSKNSENTEEVTRKDEVVNKSSKTIDNTTSLDILMGLLNEIRKITGESIHKNMENEQDHNSKELEILLSNAATHESSVDNNCRDMISASSLHKVNQLDSNTSVCSFKILTEGDQTIANNEDKHENETIKVSHNVCDDRPKNIDKEVSVGSGKQYMDKLTDAPSRFFPTTINHSTKFNDSVIEIFNAPSTRSAYSFTQYETYCNSSLDDALRQPKAGKRNISAVENAVQPGPLNISNDKVDTIVRRSLVEPVNAKAAVVVCASKLLAGPCLECDPLLKMKRDVLVTAYSVLVFAVFAALSFPQLFFKVEM